MNIARKAGDQQTGELHLGGDGQRNVARMFFTRSVVVMMMLVPGIIATGRLDRSRVSVPVTTMGEPARLMIVMVLRR